MFFSFRFKQARALTHSLTLLRTSAPSLKDLCSLSASNRRAHSLTLSLSHSLARICPHSKPYTLNPTHYTLHPTPKTTSLDPSTAYTAPIFFCLYTQVEVRGYALITQRQITFPRDDPYAVETSWEDEGAGKVCLCIFFFFFFLCVFVCLCVRIQNRRTRARARCVCVCLFVCVCVSVCTFRIEGRTRAKSCGKLADQEYDNNNEERKNN